MASATGTLLTIAPSAGAAPPPYTGPTPPPAVINGEEQRVATKPPGEAPWYYILMPVRIFLIFAGFMFLSSVDLPLPRTLAGVALFLILPEAVVGHWGLAARNKKMRRVWALLNLVLYITVLVLLILALTAPGPPPKNDSDVQHKGGAYARLPNILPLLFNVIAGFSLPVFRVFDLRRFWDPRDDDFPGQAVRGRYPESTATEADLERLLIVTPAMELSHWDGADSQQEGSLSVAPQEGGNPEDSIASQSKVDQHL